MIRRSRVPGRLAAATAAITLLALAAPATAQEAHVFLSRGSSGSDAFADTEGMGVAVAFHLTDWLRVQAGLDTRSSSLDRVGVACINPSVDWRCITESIRTENRFSSFTAAVVPYHDATDWLRISAGAGVVIGTTSSESAPASGRQAKVFAQKTAQAGGLLLADAQIRPVPSMPFLLVGQWQARRIGFEGCVDDGETYAPFCGTDWWSEVRFGVGVSFRDE